MNSLFNKIANEFNNPDSDLRSGRFAAKVAKAAVSQNEEPNIVKIVCYRCGREGHKSPYCEEKTHIKGHSIVK
jgi:hypothetical protein